MVERTAVFFDRDGTLMEDPGYPSRPEEVHLLPGAVEALHALRHAGFLLAVVSNQSGVGRGLVTPPQAAAVHERFVDELSRSGVTLDDVRYCPHAPEEGCRCRKPEPGLILDAAAALGVDTARSFLVGNSASDIAAGRAAGCRTIAFAPTISTTADWEVSTWPEVVRIVVQERTPA